MPSRSETALHEAAHAVVMTRLGVPLLMVTLEPETVDTVMRNPDTGQYQRVRVTLRAGCRSDASASGHQIPRLPDTAAAAALTRYAVSLAAGPAADEERAIAGSGDALDRDQLNEIGYILGVSPTARANPILLTDEDATIPSGPFDQAIGEPEFSAWVEEQIEHARVVLNSDGRAAWERVASKLEDSGSLTGDEVAAIVVEADGSA